MPTIPNLQVRWSDYSFSSEFSDSDSPLTSSPTDGVNESTGENPSKIEFQGNMGFTLDIDPLKATQKWAFSPELRKIFIKMGEVLPINFKVNPGVSTSDLTIRALMVYDSVDNWMYPVQRCPMHSKEKSKTNEGYPFVNHVLFCGSHDAQYHFNDVSQRYSVAVPFGEPQPGATYFTFLYGFKCKGGCGGGINRRRTSMIFTLEQNGKVMGRQVVKVRICCSPKRDMLLENKAINTPTELPRGPRGKKRKHAEVEEVKQEEMEVVVVSSPEQPPQSEQATPQREQAPPHREQAPPQQGQVTLQREQGPAFPYSIEVSSDELYCYLLKRASDLYMAHVQPKINFYKKLQQDAEKF